nr:hypothetical protein [Tanacetum cinerariifolium]
MQKGVGVHLRQANRYILFWSGFFHGELGSSFNIKLSTELKGNLWVERGGLMRFAITGAWRELCESMEAAGYFDEVIEMHDGAIAACALPWLTSLPLQQASFIMSEEASLIAPSYYIRANSNTSRATF